MPITMCYTVVAPYALKDGVTIPVCRNSISIGRVPYMVSEKARAKIRVAKNGNRVTLFGKRRSRVLDLDPLFESLSSEEIAIPVGIINENTYEADMFVAVDGRLETIQPYAFFTIKLRHHNAKLTLTAMCSEVEISLDLLPVTFTLQKLMLFLDRRRCLILSGSRDSMEELIHVLTFSRIVAAGATRYEG